jgi:hypothetical protein
MDSLRCDQRTHKSKDTRKTRKEKEEKINKPTLLRD